MKNIKIFQLVLLLFTICYCCEITAQISFDSNNPNKRKQKLNQYTSVFICSPNNGTVIQNMHDDSNPTLWPNSDKFQYYDNDWVYLAEETPTTTMQPGRGYVLQLGGDGNFGMPRPTGPADEAFDFTGGAPNSGTVTGPNLIANQFNLLGNPYSNFLNLDNFLTSLNNKTKVKGPIMLWSHNTIPSGANVNPNDPSTYVNTANDFALYNVLGGVAAGRQINFTPDGGTNTGIQTPDGKICMGTGFGVYSIGNGNIVYDDTMRDNSNGGGPLQSFRLSVENNEEEKNDSNKLAALVPSTRSRIWLNLEKGTIPSTGSNFNPLKQILIGYSPCYGTDCATNGDSDRVFDAETVSVQPSIDFYSFASGSTKHLAIQGRGDFLNTDFFQLGYKVTSGGTYTITATHDGLFDNTAYYILDAEDTGANAGVYHTLPYQFDTTAGTFDNRFKIVFQKLTSVANNPVTCGTTLQSVWSTIFSIPVGGAGLYKFEVRDNSGNFLGLFNGVGTRFNLYLPGIVNYNQTYSIRVATYQVSNNGVLSWAFGPSCTVTTPNPPTSKLTDSTPTVVGSCNSTVNAYPASLFCNIISELGFNSSWYRFQVSTTSNFDPATIVGLVEKPTNSFSLAQLRSVGYEPLPSTTYYVRVQIKYNNTGTALWQEDAGGNPIYGPVCPVTTSANPTGRFTDSEMSIFDVNAYPNPFTNNFKLDFNVSSEENIELSVFDMLGRQIDNRSIKYTDIDTQEIGESYTSGVYNVIIKQGDNIKTLRMIKR